MPSIININQVYTSENRGIHNTIHLIRELIELCNLESSSLAIVSLDQTKAFDRMNHSYRFRSLRDFRFNYIRLA